MGGKAFEIPFHIAPCATGDWFARVNLTGRQAARGTEMNRSGQLDDPCGYEKSGVQWSKKVHPQQTVYQDAKGQGVGDNSHIVFLLAEALKPQRTYSGSNKVAASRNEPDMLGAYCWTATD